MNNDMQMFGCYVDDLKQYAEDFIGPMNMLVMSILSDAQHVMECGDTETSRQYINRAKFIVSEYMGEQR